MRNMSKNELRSLISQKEREFEKAKLKRALLTTLAFATGYFLLFTNLQETSGMDFGSRLILSIVLAVIHFFSGILIFTQLYSVGEAERKHIEYLEKELSEAPY